MLQLSSSTHSAHFLMVIRKYNSLQIRYTDLSKDLSYFIFLGHPLDNNIQQDKRQCFQRVITWLQNG